MTSNFIYNRYKNNQNIYEILLKWKIKVKKADDKQYIFINRKYD